MDTEEKIKSRSNPDAIYYQQFMDEEDAPLNDMRLKVYQRMGYGGLAVVIMALIAFAVVKIPLEQNFEFILKGTKQEHTYRFTDVIHVNELFVKAGNCVKKNTPLAHITSPNIALLISNLQTAQRNLNLFYEHDTLIFNSEKSSLDLQIDELKLTIKLLVNEKLHKQNLKRKDIEQLKFKADEAQRRFEVNQRLFENKAISEFDLKDSENEKISTFAKLNMSLQNYDKDVLELENRIQKLLVNKNLLVEQITQKTLEKNKKEADLQHACKIAQEQIQLIYGNFEVKGQDLILKAEFDGEISYAFDGNKELATDEILLKMNKVSSDIYASAQVKPHRIGYIKPKQRVILKVSTFPYYEFGVLEGYIKYVSKTPDAEGNYPFEIEITDRGAIGNLLQVGMTGQLIVTTEEKTMFELIFRKLYEWKDSVVY
jgi:multidrug efflux pump subunit AcrA (membrane-fusion protein)